jgi:hypothetical protein
MPRRRLTPSEVREAQLVFASEVPYNQVWIHESARWPNWLASIGSTLFGTPPPAGGNAITLGHSCYFPHKLRTSDTDLEARVFGDMGWLLHELTHVWQYHHTGSSYITKALRSQLGKGQKAYDYGGMAGLQAATNANRSLNDFNPEQQGDIARDYYVRLKLNLSKDAWEPFVAELKGP